MKISASSQLMPNHVAGVPLAAQKAVAVAYDTNGSPLLFSLDESLAFAVTLPSTDSGTGWEQVDLGVQLAGLPGLGDAPTVQAFAASQDADGTIWLVVAAAPSATAASTVFISTGLSNGSTAVDWRGFRAHLSGRQIPAGLVVSQTVVGGIGGDHPLAVIVATDTTGAMRHLQLNPDPGPSDWQSMPLQFATNTTRCRAVAVGVNDRYGPGVYAVCELATLVNTTFTTLPQMVNGRPVVQTVELALPDGLDPQAIAPVTGADGTTELYAAGQGLYRWTVAAQTRSNQPGLPVADASSFAGVTELVAAADPVGGQVSIWGQDQRDVLMQVTGARSTGDTITWQAPLPAATEVTAIAAYRVAAEAGTSTAGLVLGTSSGALNLLVQDPQSTLWQRQTVALESPEVAQTLTTYTTRVLVTDDDGTPCRDFTVNVQPDADRTVLINGAYYALKTSVAKPATTDVNGVLTIVAETSDVTAPVYTFTATTATAATVSTTEDPGAAAKQILRGVSTGDDLADAKRCDGEPLFPTPPDQDSAKTAATAIHQVMEVHDALVAGRQPGRSVAGPRSLEHPSTLVAVRFHEGRSTLLRGQEAALPGVADGVDWLDVHPGDLLRALFGENSFSYWVDEAWNFCVKIGEQFFRFLVDLAEKAISVVDWVLRKTLGLSLDDLVAWLGFIFSWGDIRRNHTAIAKIVDMCLEWTVTGLVDAKSDVSKAFDGIRRQINNGGIKPDTSNPALQDRAAVSQDQPADSGSPEQHWGSQQLTSNGGSAKPAAATLPTIEDLWSNLAENEVAVLQSAYQQIQEQIVDHYQEYTYAQLIELFLEVVATAVVDAAEQLLLTVLDAAALMASVARTLLTARWEIPVLTYVYEEIICAGDGSKLTLLDLVSLLAAIPATIGAKLVTEQNLFSPAQLQAVADANTWDELINGLSTAPAPGAPPGLALARRDRRRLGASTDGLVAAATMEFIGMATRGISAILFGLRELTDIAAQIKNIFQIGKIAADYLTYSMSLASLMIVRGGKGPLGTRATIDTVMTVVSVAAPARDTYLVYYRSKHAGVDSPYANGLRVVETGAGIIIAICSVVSFGYQLTEPRPPGVDADTWSTLLVNKLLQNFGSGAYYALSFTQLVPAWRLEGAVFRMLILAIRWVANCIRASLQLKHRLADYDGPL